MPSPTAAPSETSSTSRPPSAAAPTADLESLGRRRAHDEFNRGDLRDRLIGADWYEDEDCTAYGLTSRQIEELTVWALEWAEDPGARIHDENAWEAVIASIPRWRVVRLPVEHLRS